MSRSARSKGAVLVLFVVGCGGGGGSSVPWGGNSGLGPGLDLEGRMQRRQEDAMNRGFNNVVIPQPTPEQRNAVERPMPTVPGLPVVPPPMPGQPPNYTGPPIGVGVSIPSIARPTFPRPSPQDILRDLNNLNKGPGYVQPGLTGMGRYDPLSQIPR
jgi:hypothetical protein